jgi:hypothetical protein
VVNQSKMTGGSRWSAPLEAVHSANAMLSNYSEAAFVENALGLGAKPYLVKIVSSPA